MCPPDYREAAVCFYCHNYGPIFSFCLKYGKKVDMLGVCAKFVSKADVEGMSK